MATNVLPTPHEFLTSSKCYVPIEIPIRPILAAKAAFGRFLKEPLEYRKQWNILRTDLDPPDDPDTGYLLRGKDRVSPEGLRYDNKSTFHFKLDIVDWLEKQCPEWRRYEDLIEASRDIFTPVFDLFTENLRVIDRLRPDLNLMARALHPSAMLDHAVRINCYDMDQPDRLLGKAHTDRDSITLQFYETHPGMRTGRLIPAQHKGEIPTLADPVIYETRPGYGLMFTGQKWETLTGLPALGHDIWEIDGRVGNRWSFVFFGHLSFL